MTKILKVYARKLANHEANVWLTVAAVLFVVLMAWFFNSKIGPLASDAAGFPFFQPQVVLIDGKNRPYPDVISVNAGETIAISYRAYNVSNCVASWQPLILQKGAVAPKSYGPINQNVVLSVICSYKDRQISDQVQVNVAGSQVSDFSVSSPSSSDSWQTGQSYTIRWSNTAADGACAVGASSCASNVIIALSPKPPQCLSSTPPCMLNQMDPYVIAENAPNTGQFSWQIPSNLSSQYWGKQQITVIKKQTGKKGISAEFSVTTPEALTYQLTTNKNSYQSGEIINMSLIVKNTSSQAKDFQFTSGCQSSYEISGTYTQSSQFCTQGLTHRTIQPGQSYTWAMSHKDPILNSGSYVLIGHVIGYGQASKTITVIGSSSDGTELRVLSPNGGEIFGIGDVAKISWEKPSTTSGVIIELRQYPSSCTDYYCLNRVDRTYTIASNVSGTSYKWTVGQSEGATVATGQYLVVISDIQTGKSDVSNGPITIEKKSSAVTN